jgi:hypothetical protein
VKLRLLHSVCGIAVLTSLFTACGGSGSGTPTPPISVAFSSQPPASIAAGATASLSAIVRNDTLNAGVLWSVTCGSSQCGSFNPTSTPSSAATTFVAPASVPSGGKVTITATSVSDATRWVTATLSIMTPAGVSVAFAAQPPTSLVQGLTLDLTGVVSGDSKNAGVTWTVSCGGTACGGFNPTATPSGVATVYTAPASVPTGNIVTIKATSVTDATKSAAASITITTPPPPVLADGTYVYHLAGEDVKEGGSPYYAAGAFTVKDGVISGGEQDFVDLNDGQTDTLIPSGCSMSTTSGGSLSVVLDTGDANVGVNGVLTLHGTKVSGSRVLISEFDSFASATGSLDLQGAVDALSGGYAFNLSGLDGAAQPNVLVMGGILNVAGNAVSVTNSTFDYNDNGSVGQAQAFASGLVSNPDSFGRVTISLSPSISSGVPQFGLSAYIVGPNRIELVEDLSDALNGVLGGTGLAQGSNTGAFNPSMVAGQTYVFSAIGADANGLATLAGGFTLNSDGTVSGDIDVYDLAASVGGQIGSGNWTIQSNGRITINNVTPSFGPPFTFQLYVNGNGDGLELGVDDTQASTGLAYLQASGSVNPGNYALTGLGFSNLETEPAWSAVGPVTLGSTLNWSGFTDYNALGTGQTSGATLSGVTIASQGLFQITGLDVTNRSADAYGFYPIDGSRTIAIEVDQNQLGTLLMEEVNP